MSADPTRFAGDWLALRAPADAAARDPALLRAARAHLAAQPAALAVDLGAGSGATVAAVGAAGIRWRLLDQDAGLLARARARFGTGIETRVTDITDIAALPLGEARLVTASALLDLMTARWAGALAERLAVDGCGLYAALSYDGHMAFTPALEGDAAMLAAFNGHQRDDKGEGPALGPDAAPVLAQALARRGFSVRTAPSPWRLGPDAARLQQEFIAGIAAAVGPAADPWAQARCAMVAGATCVVGHVDLLALPPARSQSKTTSVPSP